MEQASRSPDIRIFRVHDLFVQLRRALIALAPIAEEAGVDWRQEPPYDDWEAITDGLFDGLVASAVGNSDVAASAGTICRYGFKPSAGQTFFQVVYDDDKSFPFVRFCSGNPEFRSVWVSALEKHDEVDLKKLPWEHSRVELHLQDGRVIQKIAVEY